jgi:hypothetical protein
MEKFEIWAFLESPPEAYGGKLRFVLYRYILEELQKIKSSGFAAAMWAHLIWQ